MNSTECSYIAALLDGEGCLYAGLTKYNHIYTQLQVLCSTSKEFVETIRSIIPYKTSIKIDSNNNNPTYKPAYSLMISVKDSIKFLNEIEKYTILKKERIKAFKNIINKKDQEYNFMKLKNLNKKRSRTTIEM